MEIGLIVFLIITITIMSLGLLYLTYNIVKTKLLFKSALKSSYKSIFALTSLTILYAITFALWNSNIMFQEKMINSNDNLVAETNFHQVTIDSDNLRYGSEEEAAKTYINKDKWITDLGPTMEEMYGLEFDNWTKIEEHVLKQNQDMLLPNPVNPGTNTFYYKEFLDIWMYQNEYYQGNDKQTLPYIEFGYNELATLELVIPAKEVGGKDLSALAFRMNPIDRGVVAPIPNIGDGNQIPNQPLLKEGAIPDANDSSDGTDINDPTEIAILRSFGQSQDYPIGSTLHAKVESNDFLGSPIEYSNFYGEITGYVEHSSLTLFNASNINIVPDFTQQTIMAVPYDAFNKMAKSAYGFTYPKYEIHISFSEEVAYLKDGGSIQDFGITWNENNQEEFIKTFASYFKKWYDIPFYDEINNAPEQNEEALDMSTALYWGNSNNEYSTGINMMYEMSATNKIVSIIINSIFLAINMIFIFMVLKRKAMSQSKQIGVFKSLGYNSREISSSFITNVFIVVLFGGFLSILLAFPLTAWLEGMFITNSLGMEMLASRATIGIFLISIIIPFILMSLVVWFLLTLLLKKPPTSLLNDITANKPNFLVRGSSVVTRHLTFTNAYATKNGIRAMGKSFVTFSSIFFSTTLLLFGILVSGFADKAQESTFDLMNYESQSYTRYNLVGLGQTEINEYGSYDKNKDSYNFGVGFDYSTYGPTTNIDAYQRDPNDSNTNVWDYVFPTGYDSTKPTDRFKAWQQEILYYMRSTKVIRDKSYIDVLDPEFISSFTNTTLLYQDLLLGTDDEKKLVTKNLEFVTTSSWVPSYEKQVQELDNITLEKVLHTMLMFINNSVNLNDKNANKILFDIYETSEKQESLFNLTDVLIKEINGIDQKQEDVGLEWIDFVSGPRNSFENRAFNLTSWHRNDDLNKTLLEYENDDPTVIPVLIDYPTSKLLNIKEGDIIKLIYPHSSGESADQIPTLDVKVAGIYETYFQLPWFAIAEETNAMTTYLEEVDMYITKQDNANHMWYSNSNISNPNKIGIDNVVNIGVKHEELTTPKEYSCISSGTFYQESFYFIGAGISETSTFENLQGNSNPISSMSPCFSIDIPKEYYVAISDEGINLMNQMLGIFVGFSYIIVFFILIVISNETIQGSKREVSTLKALGYKTRTMSKIVLFGQAGVMILSIFIALPFTLIVMNIITAVLLKESGMFFDLTPDFVDIAMVIGVVLLIVVLTYIIGTIIYKHVSPLDSLQRD